MSSKARPKKSGGVEKRVNPRSTSRRGFQNASNVAIAADAMAMNVPAQTRVTDKHILFHGGILSNWHMKSPNFLGARCLDTMLPRFDDLDVKYPAANAIATQLLAIHQFNCGEQWMMAVKAWLFEPIEEPESPAYLENIADREQAIEKLHTNLMLPEPRKDWAQDSYDRRLYDSNICAILRADHPREQKALGRSVRNFDQALWEKACMPVVVASCFARAEADSTLKRVYLEAGDRKFVEGSPKDRIWGVGLKWDGDHINNESNWKGMNKLGLCHNEAATMIRQQ